METPNFNQKCGESEERAQSDQDSSDSQSRSDSESNSSDNDDDESNPGLVGRLKQAKLKNYEERINLSEQQRSAELEAQRQQLEMIFKLLKEQNDNISERDLQAQLNLYK